MAHVRFATRNDTVDPEKSSGFNGFPFATPVDTYPTIASRLLGVEWFWTVKQWHIVLDDVGPFWTFGDPTEFYFYASDTADVVTDPPLADEMGLMLQDYGRWADGDGRYMKLELADDGTGIISAKASLLLYGAQGEVIASEDYTGAFSFTGAGPFNYFAEPFEYWAYA